VLNREESYHKLHKADSYANFGKLRFKTEGEQQICNDYGRLIANRIIYYNTLILSNVLRRQAEDGSSLAAGPLAKVSPAA
jgi:TnpA family transposase